MKTLRIKFTRPAVCAGKSYSAGESAEVPPEDGFLLIGLGKAVRDFAQPTPAAVPPVIETAEATPAAERAVLPTAKKKR